MLAYFSRDEFSKVAAVHRKIIGHYVFVFESARCEITSGDAHEALTGHGQILQHRPTNHRLKIEVCDAEVLHTEHQSSAGIIFVVNSCLRMRTTEVCMPCDTEKIHWGIG